MATKEKKEYIVNIMGMKVYTEDYVMNNLIGRGGKGHICKPVFRKYVRAGMPCFVHGGRAYFTEKDINEIPFWLSQNARKGGILWTRAR